MRNTIFGRRGLSWALAAVMALTLPCTRSAWALADNNTGHLLSTQLPTGVTLRAATIDQTCDAVHTATAQRPDLATSIVQVAIEVKSPKKRHGYLPCPIVKRIARAAISSAPDRASEIIQMALSLVPECAEALDDLLGAQDGDLTPADLYGGFGVGFGPGFPGSPGFTGSPPSGATALPTPNQETGVTG